MQLDKDNKYKNRLFFIDFNPIFLLIISEINLINNLYF